MTYEEIIADVSVKLDLPKGLVDKTYKAYWKAIKEHIASLPLKEDLTDEEFMKLQPNVNIPSIGKLYVTQNRYKGVKNKYNRLIKDKQDKDVTHNKD